MGLGDAGYGGCGGGFGGEGFVGWIGLRLGSGVGSVRKDVLCSM